jgi:hypothetical protein
MTDFRALLGALANGGVRFILVGGLAAAAHGSVRSTRYVDVVYARDDENLHLLADSLCGFAPYLRGAPAGLPFVLDFATLKAGLNFTLITSVGEIDLLGEIVGGGGYQQLQPHSDSLHIFGFDCLCLNLTKLIEVKRAAGRPKDLEAIAELEAIREERERE